jgi:hypothetical protein
VNKSKRMWWVVHVECARVMSIAYKGRGLFKEWGDNIKMDLMK